MQGKYVVLFFYPWDFTFVCPTEITAFSDRHGEFASLNTEVNLFPGKDAQLFPYPLPFQKFGNDSPKIFICNQ